MNIRWMSPKIICARTPKTAAPLLKNEISLRIRDAIARTNVSQFEAKRPQICLEYQQHTKKLPGALYGRIYVPTSASFLQGLKLFHAFFSNFMLVSEKFLIMAFIPSRRLWAFFLRCFKIPRFKMHVLECLVLKCTPPASCWVERGTVFWRIN